MMTATVLQRAGDQLGTFLPRFGGALLLLIAGLILAAVLGRLVRSALIRLGLDRLVERWGVPEMLARAGLARSPAGLIAVAVRISVTVIAIFGALSLLGLQFLSDSLNEGIIFIPRLLIGIFLLFVGVMLGAQVRIWIERTSVQIDFPARSVRSRRGSLSRSSDSAPPPRSASRWHPSPRSSASRSPPWR